MIGAKAKRLPTTLATGMELFGTLVGGDLNPVLRSAYPSAVVSADQGDDAPILRLFRLGLGKAPKTKELSAALNVASLCADTNFPFAVADPLETRPARSARLTRRSIPTPSPRSTSAPFGRPASPARACSGRRRPPSRSGNPAALPDVPVLVLSGDQDLRTPNEDAMAVAARFPKASYVQVPGNGHDELGGDITGCATEALKRFIADDPVGNPCSGSRTSSRRCRSRRRSCARCRRSGARAALRAAAPRSAGDG